MKKKEEEEETKFRRTNKIKYFQSLTNKTTH
jgi:hypothetical protein